MTLEDFFTLTEMKNGLAALARVEELVIKIQKQKDCALANRNDSARQWLTVARTLATTGDDDCLNRFIQLNGLCFLNDWLQESQKSRNDISNDIVDELVVALLESLEKLPIDWEKSYTFGIGMTIEQLKNHTNADIKEKAISLHSKWNNGKRNDAGLHDMQNTGTCANDRLEPSSDAKTSENTIAGECLALEISPCKGKADESCTENESSGTECHALDDTKSAGNLPVTNISTVTMPTISSIDDTVLGVKKQVDSELSKANKDDISPEEESSVCPVVGSTPAGTCNSPISNTRDINSLPCLPEFKEPDDCSKDMELEREESNPCSYAKKESNILSSSVHSDVIVVQKAESSLCCNLGSENNVTCKLDSQPKKKVSSRRLENLKMTKPKLAQGFEGTSKAVKTREMGEQAKIPDLGPDSEIDALEIARQVAIEVEHEVVDYREPFYSSPDVNSGEIMDASSPDVDVEQKQDQPEVTSRESTHAAGGSDMAEDKQEAEVDPGEATDAAATDFVEQKQDQTVVELLTGVCSPTGKLLSDDDDSTKNNCSRYSEKVINLEENKQALESQNLSSATPGFTGKVEKKICNFDLNDDTHIEEIDCLTNPLPNTRVNLSAPVAVSATLEGAPGLLGGLAWQGSVSISAYRSAAPRTTPDHKEACSDSKQRSNFLAIDLNVAESEDDQAVNLVPKEPVSSELPSVGPSTDDANPRCPKRLKLDLNSLGNEGAPSYLPHWRLHQNTDQSLSPASSSSSRQPPMRDFDLNDKPCSLDGEHVITIMGSRVATGKKDQHNVTRQSFSGNGLNLECTMASITSLPFGYLPPAAYGCNGIPTNLVMSLRPNLYDPGEFSYMVDSRGAVVFPQVLGSVVSNSARPSSSNGVWSAQHGLDLNSNRELVGNGRWEGGTSKQPHNQVYDFLLDESAGSRITLKGKEPDCGWDPCDQMAPWR